VVYHDEPHKYYLNNQELISVTTLIHRYQEIFNEEYWSGCKANEFNLTPELIIRAWKFINKKGTMKGSIIHNYSENLFLNKVFKYPKEEILNEFGFDPIWNEYLITKNHVDRFHNDVRGKLIPIRTEMIIYDKESLIGGMLDMLFYNVRTQEFQIWDYKTNKTFSYEEKKRHLSDCLFTIEDCDLEIYSLQLSLYKLIIERNTNIKLGKSYIIWFSHNNPTYKIIEIKERMYYANLMLEKRIEELKNYNI